MGVILSQITAVYSLAPVGLWSYLYVKCIYLNFKSLHNLSDSIASQYKISEIQGNFLIVMPCKIKKTNCILSTYCGTTVVLPFQGRKWGVVRKFWTKGKTKPSMANSKSCSSMSHARGGAVSSSRCRLQRTSFLGLVPLIVCSSLWLVPYSSRTSNILGSTVQSRPYFDSFTQRRLLWVSIQGLSCHMSVLSSFP